MKKITAHEEWEERWRKDLKFWFSPLGKELQLNLVAQGYEDRVFSVMTVLFASGFTAVKIIRGLREEVE